MRPYSFSRAQCSLKHNDFIRLKTHGNVLRNPYMTVVFAPKATAVPRLGITVGKHVGKACNRNRIKRLLREFFRLNRHLLKKKWDLNIIVKKEASGMDSVRLFSEFKTALIKLSERASNGF